MVRFNRSTFCSYELASIWISVLLAGSAASAFLASRIAALDNRPADRKAFDARLLSGYQAESAKKLPEYERHDDDIKSALAEARQAK